MRLSFRHFDAHIRDCIEVVDQDNGQAVGSIQTEGVEGPIRISLFGKYHASLNRYEQCVGFVKGVEAVLNNHLTEMPQTANIQAARPAYGQISA
jgi:hypothetical protein